MGTLDPEMYSGLIKPVKLYEQFSNILVIQILKKFEFPFYDVRLETFRFLRNFVKTDFWNGSHAIPL